MNKAGVPVGGVLAAWGWASVCGACSTTACTFVPENP
ncbi:Uncharacterised protein [Mycobacterium tuberculosis]|uniref:Uncharacterized protein n=1 Tax=Mycobacterium tuberculosis TaxID=1773 RepID=A0A916LBR9_MYCTX|nr:Uncharacterised protein [Mycobacterium tuberculosis]COY39008.1 Uncharacterised protein [Mycobacterium tuberculosis]